MRLAEKVKEVALRLATDEATKDDQILGSLSDVSSARSSR
jgi:hypothetical protein